MLSLNYQLVLIFICLYFNLCVRCAEHQCFNNENENLHHHLATKTGYKFIANHNDSVIKYPGCKATKIWGLFRHGSRSPSKKIINKMKTELKLLRNQILEQNNKLCDKDRKRLRNWDPMHDDEGSAKFLIDTGSEELFELGKRFKNRFPDLLSTMYSNETHYFKYTATQRAQKSAESFANGLFQNKKVTDSIWYPEALHKDPVLRFYKACDRWKKDVDKNPHAYHEVKAFAQSDDMETVISTMEEKTGIEGLSYETVHLMYTTCAFETQDLKKISPWCALFTKETIRVIEFLEDLEYYWIDGYGFKLTYQQACAIGADLVSRIEPKTSNSPAITFYFTHSGTLLKTLAFLELYKDETVLTHRDFDFQTRQWRAGRIDAFATNLVFILFECDNDSNHVLTMHQERIIKLPGCPDKQDLCDMQTFSDVLTEKVQSCQFEQMCSLNKQNRTKKDEL